MLRPHPSDTPTDPTKPVPDERGSVAIALMIMMIITLLGAAALASSQQTLHVSQQMDQRSVAEAGAERSLAEAVSRLNNGEPLPFKGEGRLVNGSFYYKVERTDEEAVQIRAEAEVDGVYRAIEARLEGTVSGGYSVFATGWFVSDNNQGTVSGTVGTNGVIKFNGKEPGDAQEIFSPEGVCEECQNLSKSEGPWPTPEPEFPTGPIQKCTEERIFTDIVDGQNGVPFVCDLDGDAVVFKGGIKIKNPPLVVYVGEDAALLLYEAKINVDQPASDLQIYVQTNPEKRRLFLSQNTDISAIIYAPGRDILPLDFSLRGSLTVRSLEVGSKQSVSIKPDETSVVERPNRWTITSWELVPAR